MSVFVLSCAWNDNFDILGVYTSIPSALEAISRQYLEEGEYIQDFAAVDPRRTVIYSNMAVYSIDEHVLEEQEY